MTDRSGEGFAWSRIELVAFDVDGTLYDQNALRKRMLLELIGHGLTSRSLEVVRILRVYRQVREAGAPGDLEDLEAFLIEQTCERTGCGAQRVKAVVAEWIGRRPLRHLQACRYEALTELFAGLRRSGKRIGVLSDYPAHDKLKALDLTADFVVSAGDPGVMVQKPDPRGLQMLMRQAEASPQTTVLIGDRMDRDELAARRADAHSLLRSRKSEPGSNRFWRYDDRLFHEFLRA